MAIEILRGTAYRRMRWKNGLGETAEVAISPVGATLEAFDWRISMARVEADGPFSPFAGVDRTLSLLEGAGLRLAAAGRPPVDLGSDADPYAFPGELPCTATLTGGPITDLNVMTRRDRYGHRVRRIGAGARVPAGAPAELFFIAPAAATVVLRIDGAQWRLGPLDGLRVGPGRGPAEILEAGSGGLFVAEIWRQPT